LLGALCDKKQIAKNAEEIAKNAKMWGASYPALQLKNEKNKE